MKILWVFLFTDIWHPSKQQQKTWIPITMNLKYFMRWCLPECIPFFCSRTSDIHIKKQTRTAITMNLKYFTSWSGFYVFIRPKGVIFVKHILNYVWNYHVHFRGISIFLHLHCQKNTNLRFLTSWAGFYVFIHEGRNFCKHLTKYFWHHHVHSWGINIFTPTLSKTLVKPW